MRVFQIWIWFLSFGCLLELITEFGKVFSVGEYSWAWLSSQRIRLTGFFFFFNWWCWILCVFLSCKILMELLFGLMQGLWRGGLLSCSCTRRREDLTSMLSSFTSLRGESLIFVCNVNLSVAFVYMYSHNVCTVQFEIRI